MANKAFMTFMGVGVDGSGPAYGVAIGVVYDTAGVLLAHPLNSELFYYSTIAYLTRSSTWTTVKSSLESDIKAAYGATTTTLWLDDKGIL